jgi:hypothetical protein
MELKGLAIEFHYLPYLLTSATMLRKVSALIWIGMVASNLQLYSDR